MLLGNRKKDEHRIGHHEIIYKFLFLFLLLNFHIFVSFNKAPLQYPTSFGDFFRGLTCGPSENRLFYIWLYLVLTVFVIESVYRECLLEIPLQRDSTAFRNFLKRESFIRTPRRPPFNDLSKLINENASQ